MVGTKTRVFSEEILNAIFAGNKVKITLNSAGSLNIIYDACECFKDCKTYFEIHLANKSRPLTIIPDAITNVSVDGKIGENFPERIAVAIR